MTTPEDLRGMAEHLDRLLAYFDPATDETAAERRYRYRLEGATTAIRYVSGLDIGEDDEDG